MTIRIRDVYRTVWKTNPISGHSWPEHGPTTGYEIVGPYGVLDKARTQEAAERKRDEWEAYYARVATVVGGVAVQ